jgi:hypothetical protein
MIDGGSKMKIDLVTIQRWKDAWMVTYRDHYYEKDMVYISPYLWVAFDVAKDVLTHDPDEEAKRKPEVKS